MSEPRIAPHKQIPTTRRLALSIAASLFLIADGGPR